MPYWPIGFWFFALALFMGWVMGPATDSVMGAVPEEKAGVASAMNDVTRQVGGRARHGRHRLAGRVVVRLPRSPTRRAGLPPGAAGAVEDSIGGADAVAGQLPADQAGA